MKNKSKSNDQKEPKTPPTPPDVPAEKNAPVKEPKKDHPPKRIITHG